MFTSHSLHIPVPCFSRGVLLFPAPILQNCGQLLPHGVGKCLVGGGKVIPNVRKRRGRKFQCPDQESENLWKRRPPQREVGTAHCKDYTACSAHSLTHVYPSLHFCCLYLLPLSQFWFVNAFSLAVYLYILHLFSFLTFAIHYSLLFVCPLSFHSTVTYSNPCSVM